MIDNIARASYGIIVRRPVSSWKQLEGWKSKSELNKRKIEKCSVTGKKFFTDTIQWLILEDTYVAVGRTTEKRIFADRFGRWTETLVRHEGTKYERPQYLNADRSERVVELQKMDCEVKPDLEDLETGAAKLKRAGIRGIITGTELEYTMQVRLSGAKVMFELIFNGKVLQGETIQIEVKDNPNAHDSGEHPAFETPNSGIQLPVDS